jgi:hypothetical protein
VKEITKIYGNHFYNLSELQNKVLNLEKISPQNAKLLWTDLRSQEREKSREIKVKQMSPKKMDGPQSSKFKQATSRIIAKPVVNEPKAIVPKIITKVKMTPFLRRV